MKTNLNINIAKDEYENDLIIDLSVIRHLLIAGNTGTGKSSIIHNMISTLISNNPPEDIRFILSDPKQVELSMYSEIPHLLTPVITDIKKIVLAMKWAGKEMERRLEVLKKNNCKDIREYKGTEHMPSIVIIIDEIYNSMRVYPKETETAILPVAQMGHIVGIHLIISTSRPNTKVFTKTMRDYIDARITLQTSSVQDSKSVIGTGDACSLKGEGHMLYREGMKYIIRGQSSFISIEEIRKVVKIQVDAYREEVMSEINLRTPHIFTSDGGAIFSASLDSDDDDSVQDELYEQAKQIVIESGKASTSYLQRKLGIGYSRSAQLIDLLECGGVVGPANGSKAREVFNNKK